MLQAGFTKQIALAFFIRLEIAKQRKRAGFLHERWLYRYATHGPCVSSHCRWGHPMMVTFIGRCTFRLDLSLASFFVFLSGSSTRVSSGYAFLELRRCTQVVTNIARSWGYHHPRSQVSPSFCRVLAVSAAYMALALLACACEDVVPLEVTFIWPLHLFFFFLCSLSTGKLRHTQLKIFFTCLVFFLGV